MRLLLALVLFLPACSGPSGPRCAAADCHCDASGCACSDGSSCGWTAVDGCAADGSGCHLQCAARGCVASCTATCEAGCTAGASCDVEGTESATLYCSRSDCEISGTAGTSATCTDGATCRVRCEVAPCGIDCREDAQCALACPGDVDFHAVTGHALCPTP